MLMLVVLSCYIKFCLSNQPAAKLETLKVASYFFWVVFENSKMNKEADFFSTDKASTTVLFPSFVLYELLIAQSAINGE